MIAAAVEDEEPLPNRAPVANAGADQNGTVGTQVTLQGRRVFDPDGDPLTFEWRTVSSPGGIPVSLTGGATAQATFTPTTAGVYEFELTVSDGELAARDTVRVTVGAANRAPVVDAGSDQSITLGAWQRSAVASDPDADPLTFAWIVQSRPAGSTAALSATNTAADSITPDVAGEYVLQVTVSDGRGGQATDAVKITATPPGMNRAPTADAGFDLNGTETVAVTLDGTNSSDPDGDPLTFSWTLVSVPAGSTAGIIAANAAIASFTPDVEGVYVVQLEVSDGQFTSTDTATITVGPFNHPPVGTLTIGGSAQILAGTSVTATAAFTDADGDPLDFTWTLDTPAGSSASLSISGDETQATFTADVPGDYVIELSVTDGDNVVENQLIVTAYPLVAGTYTTDFTLTFISSVCEDALGLTPGQSVVVDMLVGQPSPNTAQLGISALIPNVQSDPLASLSPNGLAVFSGSDRARYRPRTAGRHDHGPGQHHPAIRVRERRGKSGDRIHQWRIQLLGDVPSVPVHRTGDAGEPARLSAGNRRSRTGRPTASPVSFTFAESSPCREPFARFSHERHDHDRRRAAPRPRAARHDAPMPRLASGGGASDAHEQPRPRSRRGSRPARRLRRLGPAARSWECFDAIVSSLEELESDETLCVQSGKPVGVFRTHPMAPRVLIANANVVPRWATVDEFRRLEGLGLTMYGQMTAGSWIYIGTQGILQGTYETFAAVAARHFGGSLAGRWILTGGCGGMGGAQPLAATMNGAACLIVEVDPLGSSAGWRAGTWTRSPRISTLLSRASLRRPPPGGSLGGAWRATAREVLPEIARRDQVPDVLPIRLAPTTRSTDTCPQGSTSVAPPSSASAIPTAT